jgi:hypothetical protein
LSELASDQRVFKARSDETMTNQLPCFLLAALCAFSAPLSAGPQTTITYTNQHQLSKDPYLFRDGMTIDLANERILVNDFETDLKRCDDAVVTCLYILDHPMAFPRLGQDQTRREWAVKGGFTLFMGREGLINLVGKSYAGTYFSIRDSHGKELMDYFHSNEFGVVSFNVHHENKVIDSYILSGRCGLWAAVDCK